MSNSDARGDTQKIFLTCLGFEENPFTYTNADEEERLQTYFIPPPYFHAVFGDPDRPKSVVVFAPRGGGKTAQRIMIENQCAENHVFAITYTQFEFANIQSASDIELHHHIQNILRFALMGVFVTLHDNSNLSKSLTNHDKEVLVKLAAEHFKGVTSSEIKKTLESLKSIKEKVRSFWNDWLPFISTGMSTVVKRYTSLDMPELSKFDAQEANKPVHLKYELSLIVEIIRKLGFRSIYVLIDRIDESELSGNDPVASFKVIEPILRDLQLLEFDGVGLKLFLWDQLEPSYSKIARRDRVQQETLEWDDAMLKEMWSKRLEAFSRGRINSLNVVSLRSAMSYPTDELALVFANGSPRDMIRIGRQIITEQLQTDPFAEYISPEAIYRAVEKFCELRASEVATPRVLHALRRLQRVDFTIPYLSSIIFREQQSNSRSRVTLWRREGDIIDIDKVENPNPLQTQQVKLLGIGDIRIAKAIYPNLDIPLFLRQKYKKCPRCGATVLREWGDALSSSVCHECQFDLATDAEKDAQEVWRRRQMATQARSRRRQENLDLSQLQMDFDNPPLPNVVDEGEEAQS